MKTFTKPFFLIVFFSLNFSACESKSNFIEDKMNAKENSHSAKINDTTLFSPVIGDSIKLEISLPYKYKKEKSYPVIYMTDGYWRREEHDSIHNLGFLGKLPKVIVAAIGYPDGYDYGEIRKRDLIVHSDRFLKCIKDEIIPYVENKYKILPEERTLWGSSFGGHFLIYAFTQHINSGELFKNYICASPALNPEMEHSDLIANEQKLWESTQNLPLNLYIAVGGDETEFFLDSYKNIVGALKMHPYKNFLFKYEIIPGTHHHSVWKPALFNGLKLFLKNN